MLTGTLGAFSREGLVGFGIKAISPISRNPRIRSALKNHEILISHSSTFFMFVGRYVPLSTQIFSFGRYRTLVFDGAVPLTMGM